MVRCGGNGVSRPVGATAAGERPSPHSAMREMVRKALGVTPV